MKLKAYKMKKIVFWVGLLFLIPTLPFAQEYPTKPINMLVALAPGGIVDSSIRVLASKAEKFLGQPFIISNNGGGGGSVAFGILAREKPDGYHLVGSPNSPLVRIPHLRSVPYRIEDFIPIMHFGTSEAGLVVRADSPWKTLKEFVEYARKNPWKVTLAIPGTGTPQHIAMEYIGKKEGIQWTMVPYSGGAPGITALLGGHVTAYSGSTVWVPHVKAGSLRLLSTNGERRMKAFPEVPTLRQLGYDYSDEAIYMVTAPKGTPLSIVKKLDDAFRKAMDDPEFVRSMEKMEIEIYYRNHEDIKKHLEEAYHRFGKMIIDLKIPKESEQK